MKNGILVRILGGLLIVIAFFNLAATLMPEVSEQIISLPAILVRYLLMLIAGAGLVLLRKWGLYVFITLVAINWVVFYTVYEGVSKSYPLAWSFIGPIVLCALYYFSRRAFK